MRTGKNRKVCSVTPGPIFWQTWRLRNDIDMLAVLRYNASRQSFLRCGIQDDSQTDATGLTKDGIAEPSRSRQPAVVVYLPWRVGERLLVCAT
jgi:hypothetical protein